MIIVTTPALAAAERVRNSCRIITYRRAEPQPDHQREPRKRRTARIRNRVRELLAGGDSTAEIAAALDITEAGVRYHLRAIATE